MTYFASIMQFMFTSSIINTKTRLFIYSRLIKKAENVEFTHHCSNYFMGVVSTLCFGGRVPPEPDLIRMLMDMMTEKQGVIWPFGKLNAVPVVTSSLLQLLLEHKYVQRARPFLTVYTLLPGLPYVPYVYTITRPLLGLYVLISRADSFHTSVFFFINCQFWFFVYIL